ncbi:MAG: hypothetical protein WCJ84_02950 [Candidatus Peregrinibacteria bacterium]
MNFFEISRLKILWKLLFWGILLLLVFSFFLKGALPDSSKIQPALFTEPLQEETERKDFSFLYRETEYKVHPMYYYELNALVVSHNDIGGWGDIYHDENSLDLKDLCVVWGDNLKDDIYKKIDVKNTSWTCWVDAPPAGVLFHMNKLSNNHLISSDPKIQEKIRNIHRGDQVHIKGLLVSYTRDGYLPRVSSITREDTGNHACEVFFVDELEILRPAPPFWFFAYTGSQWVLGVLLCFRVWLWFYEGKKEREEWNKRVERGKNAEESSGY